MPADRGAESAGRAVTDAFGDVGKPAVVSAEQILRHVGQASRYFVSGRPTSDSASSRLT